MIRRLALPLLVLLLHATVAGSAFAERRPVDEALVREAIEHGADVSAKGGDGRTALMLAARGKPPADRHGPA